MRWIERSRWVECAIGTADAPAGAARRDAIGEGAPDRAGAEPGAWLAKRGRAPAVLRQAGVQLPAKTAGVAQVEDSLSTWHRVHIEKDVRAGDIVIYRHRLSSSRSCTGGGSCHVVISVGGSRVFGNSSYDIPLFARRGPELHYRIWLTLAGYEFKVAYRAP